MTTRTHGWVETCENCPENSSSSPRSSAFWVQICPFSCSFWEKVTKIIGWHPTRCCRRPLWEILDPPLHVQGFQGWIWEARPPQPWRGTSNIYFSSMPHEFEEKLGGAEAPPWIRQWFLFIKSKTCNLYVIKSVLLSPAVSICTCSRFVYFYCRT